MKSWVIVLFSDEPYIQKALNTIHAVRNNGSWKEDIVLLIPSSLFNNEIMKDFASKYNVELRELPENNIKPIIDAWDKHKNHDNYSYIISRKYMYMKFHVFDIYFKKWDVVFYIDCMNIHGSLERMKKTCEPDNCIYAHSDAYPSYVWKLERQFNIELFSEEEKKDIYKYNLDIDHFQGTMFIYDTKITDENTVKNLFELAFKYKYSYRMDQGILNLYFLCERNLWKQIPVKDEVGFLYDYHRRDNYSIHDYLMLKAY